MDSLKQIIDIVRKIESNELGIIVGSRKIAEFRDYFINDNPDVLSYSDLSIFFDIEFKTKNIPISIDERAVWGKEALKAKDEEIKELEKQYGKQIMSVCRKIITKFDNE